MKNLKTIDDFVLNSEFRNWVLSPSASSNVFWEKWLQDHPDKKDNFQQAVKVVQSIGRVRYEANPEFQENIWKKVHSKLDHTTPSEREVVPLNIQSVTKDRKKGHGSNKLIFWSLAASILLLITSVYVLFHEHLLEMQEPETISTILKSNPKGQKSTIMLPDGTTVMLNSESTLTYTSEYYNEERRVTLKGVAFFEVTEDPQKPFVVETKNLVTTALGTSFNVNAYPQENEEVTLVTGSIKIETHESGHNSTILFPGEMLALGKAGTFKTFKTSSFDHIGWKDGVIVFQDTPLAVAIAELEKWYGVEIIMNNYPKGNNMNFTGSFRNDNLSNVLKSLSYTMPFDFKIEGKKALVNFK
ncbi:MAG: DUF4974 domain-containing protein [Cyclobacteriaceae bacterium]